MGVGHIFPAFDQICFRRLCSAGYRIVGLGAGRGQLRSFGDQFHLALVAVAIGAAGGYQHVDARPPKRLARNQFHIHHFAAPVAHGAGAEHVENLRFGNAVIFGNLGRP